MTQTPSTLIGKFVDDDPLFSVIIPCFNRSQFIHRSAQSVLKQKHARTEIIVVDDGSDEDLTVPLAECLDDLIYVRKDNGGVCSARNAALHIARGKWIVLVDSDDFLAEDYLKQLSGEIQANPEVLAFVPNLFFFGDSKYSGTYSLDRAPITGEITFDQFVLGKIVLAGCSVFKTELLKKLGGWNEHQTASEDFELWMRILHSGAKVRSVASMIYHYQRHSISISASKPEVLLLDGRKALASFSSSHILLGTNLDAVRRKNQEFNAELSWLSFKDALRRQSMAELVDHYFQLQANSQVPRQTHAKAFFIFYFSKLFGIERIGELIKASGKRLE